MDNSKTTTRTNAKEREGKEVKGTSYEIICDDHYVQSNKEITCGVDGKWTPTIECVPGK